MDPRTVYKGREHRLPMVRPDLRTRGLQCIHRQGPGQLSGAAACRRENPRAKAYDPERIRTVAGKISSMVEHDVQINAQYKRLLHSDIQDVEDLGLDQGGVLNPKTSHPQAVYKDKDGKVHRMSAVCPHLKGIVCWNNDEKSWDCPIHGSRFSPEGLQVCNPSKRGLQPFDNSAKARQRVNSETYLSGRKDLDIYRLRGRLLLNLEVVESNSAYHKHGTGVIGVSCKGLVTSCTERSQSRSIL
ncbi:hypothetical protein MMC13_007872 [Lambiella insularis]|nr:hypothetical protein [Lambiella insularis]